MGWAIKSAGKWRFKWREGGRVRTMAMPEHVTTKKEAQKISVRLTKKMREKGQLRPKPYRLEELKETILKQADYSDRNKANVEKYWDTVFAFFGRDRHVSTITKTDLLAFVQSLKKEKVERNGKKVTRKNTTLRHYFYTIAKALEVAKEEESILRNPADLINLSQVLPDDTAARERRISEAEFKRMLDFTEAPWTETYLRIGWATGARMREITGLRWEDIDFKAHTIHFRPNDARAIKNKRDRKVHVSPALLDHLREVKEKAQSEWVIAKYNGKRVDDVKKSVQRTAERAGLEGVSTHIVRHSVGSLLAGTGTPLTAVRDILGHSDLRVTSRYTHSNESERKAAAETLARIYGVPNAYKNAYKDPEIMDRLEECEEFVSLRESIFRVVERETGFEPATLSLEG